MAGFFGSSELKEGDKNTEITFSPPAEEQPTLLCLKAAALNANMTILQTQVSVTPPSPCGA